MPLASRVSTGIDGLDEVLGGGLPDKKLILLSGACGTGKTIFSAQFLVDGAKKGEPGVYVSLEEKPEAILENMKLFGWDADALVSQNLLLVIQPKLYDFDMLKQEIVNAVDKVSAKRMVIDSASIIGLYYQKAFETRHALLDLSNMLKQTGTTTLLVSEMQEGSHKFSLFGVEEFISDGVIVLQAVRRGNSYTRTLLVRKMRGVTHSMKIYPLDIDDKAGVRIYPNEEVFTE